MNANSLRLPAPCHGEANSTTASELFRDARHANLQDDLLQLLTRLANMTDADNDTEA
jgi:hypothetical protein